MSKKNRKRRSVIAVILLIAFLITGCEDKSVKTDHIIRIGVVTYTQDDPFINAMTDQLKENLKKMDTNHMKIITTVKNGDDNQQDQNEIVEEMIDAGCAVALATDLNPGSCFSGSIPLTIALACIYMKMSVEESITALTLNGAAALNRAGSIGSIEVGKKGDFVVLNTDNYHFLPYYVGMNCVHATVKEGVLHPVL